MRNLHVAHWRRVLFVLCCIFLMAAPSAFAQGDYPDVPDEFYRVGMLNWDQLKENRDGSRFFNLFTDKDGAEDFLNSGRWKSEEVLYTITKEDLAKTEDGRAFLEKVQRVIQDSPNLKEWSVDVADAESFRETITENARSDSDGDGSPPGDGDDPSGNRRPGAPDDTPGFKTDGPYKVTEMSEKYKKGEKADSRKGVYYVDGSDVDVEHYRVRFTPDENGVVRMERRDANGDWVRIDTNGLGGRNPESCIYVMDAQGRIYVIHEDWEFQRSGKKAPIHHSSVPSGRDVAGAGHMRIVDGVLVGIDNGSGHYGPENSRLEQVLDELYRQGVDVSEGAVETKFMGFEDRPGQEMFGQKVPGEPLAPREERLKRIAREWDDPRAGSSQSVVGDLPPSPPDPPGDAPRTDPPSVDQREEIRKLIEGKQASQMDEAFMRDVYSKPNAAKIVGEIMGKTADDPSLVGKNRRMGQLRLEMDRAVWKEILKKYNIPVETSNFGKSDGAKSDLDYTLYHVARETGISIEDLIKEHEATWRRLHFDLTPAKLEINVINGDAFYPDWRSETLSSAEHQTKIKNTMRLLRDKSDVYFVPGATKSQTHNDGLARGVTTVMEYNAGDDALRTQTGLSREISRRYEGLSPDYGYRNSLGTMIQEYREFLHHGGDYSSEAVRRSKHVGRVIDKGLGALAGAANTYQDIAKSNLPPAEKARMQRGILERAFRHLDLPSSVIDEYARIIDITMQIELDKVQNTGDFNSKRAEYFSDYRSRAEQIVMARKRQVGGALDVGTYETLVLAEQQRLFENDQRRVMAEAILAGLEYSALRDLTPEGAIRNGLRFETDPETGRPKAVFDEARIRKVAFERATEYALLAELVENTNDPRLKELRSRILERAPTPELRDLYRKLSRVKSTEIDNFLNDSEGKYGGKIQMTIDDFINRKIERCRELGIDLVNPDEADRLVTDAQVEDHVVQSQMAKLNPMERTSLQDAIRVSAGEIGREMWGKTTGLMVGSSVINIVRAMQVGDEHMVRHAFITESLNFMPDYIEIPFTVLDALMRTQKGDASGFWDIGLMGALRYVPGVGHVLLVKNIAQGSFGIVRTYIVTQIDQDLVEQALKSRPRDIDGNPQSGMKRARRNPRKDSKDTFRGDTPLFPIFYDEFPVPEDAMSDYELYRQAKAQFAGQIIKDLKKQNLEPETDEWVAAADELAWKYGFDLPFYARMAKMYEFYSPKVRAYVIGAMNRPGGEYVEDVAIRSFMHKAVMAWYAEQPYGYRREFQGYFDMIFGDQEKGLLDQLVNAMIVQYRQQESQEDALIQAQEEDRREREKRFAQATVLEKQLLATGQNLRDQIARAYEEEAREVAQQALAQLEDYKPTLSISYPWTYATQEIPPPLDILVRTPDLNLKHPLKLWVEEEQVAASVGAPSGWEPGEGWAEFFEPDEEGEVNYAPVTVDYQFTATLYDADSVKISEEKFDLPIVQYLSTRPFNGEISVLVLGATASGEEEDYYEYTGAVVTVGEKVDTTGLYGGAYFNGLAANDYTIQVQPREGDERHGEGTGSASLVDTLAAPPGTLEGKSHASVRVVLPYIEPPEDPIAENEDEEDEGEGGGEEDGNSGGTPVGVGVGTGSGGDTGGGETGGGETGGGETGGNTGGGTTGGQTGPTPEDLIRDLQPLTSDLERRRNEAEQNCNYEDAAALQQDILALVRDFIANAFPQGIPANVQPIIQEFEAKQGALDKAAEAERSAKDRLREARTQLLAKEVENALTSLETAAAVPNLASCLRDRIMTLYSEIQADVEEMSERIDEVVAAGNDACDYKLALQLAEDIEREAPTLSWVQEELPKIRQLAKDQKEAAQLVLQAKQRADAADLQVQQDNKEAARALYQEAITLAQQAFDVAPACNKAGIEAYMQGIAQRGQQATQPTAVTVERSLLLLIDTSGSMGNDGKMAQAKQAATSAVKALSPNVEVALISYDGGCSGGWRVVQDFTTDKQNVINAIGTLNPGAGTPMAPAVSFAQQYMEQSARSSSGQILLLSDGQNDCGSTRDAGENLSRSTMNVRIDAVGFGLGEGSQAETDLTDLVRASGNGNQYSANSAGELIRAFRRAFMADQVKATDPYVDGTAGATLQQLFAAAIESLKQNDVRGARQSFEQAVAQVPQSPAAHYNLSLAYEAEGQILRAIDHGNQYLALAPSAFDAGTVRERIAQLEAEQRENPHAIYTPGACQHLYLWGQREAAQVRDASRKAKAYAIMTAAQRGDCATAQQQYNAYQQ